MATEAPSVSQTADRAGTPPEDGAVSQIVSFRLGKEVYGVDVMQVQEIILLGQITEMPNVPECVCGLINQKTAELNHETRPVESCVITNFRQQFNQSSVQRPQIQGLFFAKIRYAEPPAEVDGRQRSFDPFGRVPRQIQAFSILT